jgi:3-(3-hydroxy-phenyl)propionate hydroxylase
MSEPEVDVAIVGFGPTGAQLANLLGRAGIRFFNDTATTEIYTLPRAVHFDHEIMRTFQSLGLADEILPFTGPILGYEFRNGAGDLLMSVDVRGQIASQGWRPDYMFHQPSLEKVLRDGAEAHDSVDVALGSELVGLSQDDEGVQLTLRDAGDGGERTLRARYVVGCDGASSPTRELAGLPIEDLAFDEPWLVVDATSERTIQQMGLPEMPFQLCDPKRPTTFIPVTPPYIRWEFMLLPGEGLEMQEPERVRALIAEWTDPDGIEVIRSAVYRFHALVGERWRDGRVLVAGDAAHQMPPFLGQGMCAGMRDAANLAWKLELVLGGRAGEGLLDSYQRERAPHVRQIIETAVGMGRIICTLDPEVAKQRDAQMLSGGGDGGAQPTGMPDLRDGFLAKDHPLVGALGLQARVRGADGREALLDDHVGPGFALLWHGSPAALSTAADALLERLGARRVSIGKEGAAVAPAPTGAELAVEDLHGDYAGWFAKHDAAAVLVRPDFTVCAAGRAPADVSASLESLVPLLA